LKESYEKIKTERDALAKAKDQLEKSGREAMHNVAADISSINTDGNEYEVGFNTQKILNRMLENQITDLAKRHESERDLLLKDIKSLRDETSRQHDLLLKDLPPESLAEAAYKSEILKLADQNLELSEKCDKYNEEIKRYKKMLKIYIKRNRTSNLTFFSLSFNFAHNSRCSGGHLTVF
jgi:hypothetical protein